MHAALIRITAPVLGSLILLIASPAAAQDCENPVCRSGETYRAETSVAAPYGVCQSGSCGPGFCSHYIAACPAGWTLDVPTGACHRDLCSGCGADVPLCESSETFTRSETGPDGRVYGVCSHGSCGPGFCSHQVKYCRDGWTLQRASGLCRRECAAALKPDLVITRVWLKSRTGALIKTVRAGRSYYACFEVANIGAADSGPFRVGGGGLGVPVAPVQAHAGLSRGSNRAGCLLYDTTPRPGRYRLGISADSRTVIDESREDNNERILTVIVTR